MEVQKQVYPAAKVQKLVCLSSYEGTKTGLSGCRVTKTGLSRGGGTKTGLSSCGGTQIVLSSCGGTWLLYKIQTKPSENERLIISSKAFISSKKRNGKERESLIY